MHSHYQPKETIRELLLRDLNAIQCLLAAADTTAGELVLEQLPSGEYAWLRPDIDAPIPYVLTTLGREQISDVGSRS